ncbi:PREDICTED: protein FAR1-RELATED SEQUENCE 5-like [Erythranthe guttata]|uniref:protein FAR1-RELATED SEQUENCE 5-like n=1 Tax=Erythranthe guttata TaxID=4155 RepID=UPI00064D7C80|nr:PREDICTED: protein FAR1-RELATED SEQUENCE 5-like [Erythranthe guttata]|eukprot:XP_012847831.1 PREDICTED: protein FAR1-RELATED SEQUENCE 5-like [Erythranthe guttata]
MTSNDNRMVVYEQGETIKIDCTHSFTTSEKFPTKEALLAWVREVCKRIGMVLMIAGSSDGDRGRRTLYVIVRCERGSHYVGKKGTKEPKDNEKAEWKLDVYSGIHNHNLFENLNGHSYTGRLSKERTSFVHTMKKAMVKPRAILRLLKEKDPSNVTGIKTVYNTISKLNFSELSGRSQLQLLFVKLKEDEYLSYHRSNELNAITDLLWIHPKCIKLAQSYPYVFIIDCTYKTNRYGLPFLEIVGFTCTNMTFSIAFAYLDHEKTENFEWALRCLKEAMTSCPWPNCIVTDRDLALMKECPMCIHRVITCCVGGM